MNFLNESNIRLLFINVTSDFRSAHFHLFSVVALSHPQLFQSPSTPSSFFLFFSTTQPTRWLDEKLCKPCRRYRFIVIFLFSTLLSHTVALINTFPSCRTQRRPRSVFNAGRVIKMFYGRKQSAAAKQTRKPARRFSRRFPHVARFYSFYFCFSPPSFTGDIREKITVVEPAHIYYS